MQNLSRYEQLRLENIERNRLFLLEIGLTAEVTHLSHHNGDNNGKEKKRRRVEVAVPLIEGMRKSSRVANMLIPNYKVDKCMFSTCMYLEVVIIRISVQF
jgi:hypothetical protein